MTATTGTPAFVPMGGSTPADRRVLRTDRLAALGSPSSWSSSCSRSLGPWIAPYPAQGYGERQRRDPQPRPQREHWFGTDQLGRDILSRVVIGARPALTISLFVVAIAAASASRSAPSPATAAAGSTAC